MSTHGDGEGTAHPPVEPATRRGFRRDVEGLRALAVMAVVLYHAGVPKMSGGYVGVDVFFVLSGFLITGLLVDELSSTGRIKFAAFYGRRARRLLPASALVIVVTLAASWQWLSPIRVKDIARDAVAAATYVPNYRFAAQSTDYLTSQLPPSPLQHFWSLAVEEQFYLVWPALIFGASLAWRRSRRVSRVGIGVALAVTSIASFAAAVHLTAVNQPWAFFSLPTRAWELAAGATLALVSAHLARLPRGLAAVFAWGGVLAVVAAVVAYDEGTTFPGVAALLPVLGTAFAVAGGEAAAGLGPGRLFALWPIPEIAKLSYSLYLWHWPMLILVPAALGEELNTVRKVAVVGLSTTLAALTYVIVENPVRFARPLVKRAKWSLTLGVTLTVVTAAIAVAIGASVSLSNPSAPVAAAPVGDISTSLRASARTQAVPANLTPALADVRDDIPLTYSDGCHLDFEATIPGECAYGSPAATSTVVLFGDSHAAQWFPAVEALAEREQWRLLSFTKSGCPAADVTVWNPVLKRVYDECDEWRANAMELIRASGPALVLVSDIGRYQLQDDDAAGDDAELATSWRAGLRATLTDLGASAGAVAVISDTPWPEGDVPDCVAANLSSVSRCARSAAVAVDRRHVDLERQIAGELDVPFMETTNWFCTPDTCPVVVGNLLVYRDNSHMTTSYATSLAPVLLGTLSSAHVTPSD